MELAKAQIDKLNEFIKLWLKDEKCELEVTFGQKGVIDSNTFLSIAQRLKSKGMAIIPQEDYLNIITPNNLRVTLNSFGVVQSYCKNDSLVNKEYTILRKDKIIHDGNLDIAEYNLRFKVRSEKVVSKDDPDAEAMITNWSRQLKAFRLIRRWSFEYKSMRFDLSMIRQTPTDPQTGQYQWVRTFLQRNILQEPPRYEVEVEVLRSNGATPESTLKELISSVGEVQRAIQKNTLLIRNSVINTVRAEYAALMKSEKFRGVGPVTLQLQNMTQKITKDVENIREGYNVTDKADGLRTMGFVNKDGELYLLDQSMNVYRTGLRSKACANTLVDGEWVTKTKDDIALNHFLIFDIYVAESGRSSGLPFATFKDTMKKEEKEEKDEKIIQELDTESNSRYNYLTTWFQNWKAGEVLSAKGINANNQLIVSLKTFKFGNIFSACSEILDNPGRRIYYTDGLIITSNNSPLPERDGVRFEKQFKWKPSKDNTVDFLINFERDPESPNEDRVHTMIDPANETIIRYKTMRLYVGGAKSSADDNPRQAILLEEPILKEYERNIPYKPILFNPVDFPDTMANTCNIIINMNNESLESYVTTHDTKEPISDRSIIEMRYDPSAEPGWRWIPSRIRHDKTERLLRAVAKGGVIKYSGMMNDTSVANSVWNSIHDPVTEFMIRTGSEDPTDVEVQSLLSSRESEITKKYYESKPPKDDISFIRTMLDFHNKYIKNKILLESVLKGGKKKIIDLACGKAGDLNKWHFNGAGYVIGVDTAGENITNSSDGAYKRYVELIRKFGKANVPYIAFAIGNSSKRIVDGTAGANSEERDILRAVFGQKPPEGPIPNYINRNMLGVYKNGADVAACMFALHYFFESAETLNGFMQNLADTVAYGGYFVGCCFDGDEVFKLLRNVKKMGSVTGKEGDVPIWSIKKEYDIDELRPDESSIGLPINVEFISIGTEHREYLVSFEFLKKKLSTIGFDILGDAECRDLGLRYPNRSTALFKESYDITQKENKRNFKMDSQPVRTFSFLNRWFIFKRNNITRTDVVSELNEPKVTYESKRENSFDEDEEPVSKGLQIKKLGPTYQRYKFVESSSYSVLKEWHKKDVNPILTNWVPPQNVHYIVDGTAHVGMDSINLANQYRNALVHAYEVVTDTYSVLVENIKIADKVGIIIPHFGDFTLWEPPAQKVDILYLDPPWGGEDYLDKKSLDLYLQAEGEKPDETKNLVTLIKKWNATNKIKNIIFKAPKNFNIEPLKQLFKTKMAPVYNQKKTIAYNLILVTNQIQPTDEIGSSIQPSSSAAASSTLLPSSSSAAASSAAVPSSSSAAVPSIMPDSESKEEAITYKHRFDKSEIFSIGDDASFDLKIRVIEIPSVSKIEKDDYPGKRLSLSAHFPIPDQDDPQINYPSIEHYLAAMKIKEAGANKADRKILANDFSMLGKTHDKALKKLQKVKIVYSSEYYDIIKAEATEVRRLLSTENKYKYNNTTWLAKEMGHLEYAIKYRLEHDAPFIDCVNKAAEFKKYILYLSDNTEYGGKLSRLSEIIGMNKIGKMIMKLSKNPLFDTFKLTF